MYLSDDDVCTFGGISCTSSEMYNLYDGFSYGSSLKEDAEVYHN